MTKTTTATNLTATKTAPPDWLLAVFDDIDTKRFGAAFDVMTEDAKMQFGVIDCVGRDTIRHKLHEFDGEMTTKHHILEYWDAGSVKFFSGKIDITNPKTGKTISPVLNHIWYMSIDQPDKVAVMVGSVGPMVNLS